MLLSVVVLVVVHIIEEEEITLIREAERSTINQRQDILSVGKRRQDLVSSLQRLNDFEGLLTPPPLVSSLANQAAVKAMMFVSGLPVGSGYIEGMSLNDFPINICEFFIMYFT
ncbi:mediator of RNA polymerase II transcription subunit 33A [Dorcoceras hygrometricum]|uniref:Mediator of RNA polymerase II transcription subunit 33A n=1 Tax=Dorcoceras hygrometricum TaxID=472368 RepID=A0A2Z7D0E9_9LAMI|nr:mediator of RNA polymerase II transcription subunit 33A [Dorcoceras hygrometricum]